ncbi:hypothetical protein BDW68DRAFT_161978 [Aspergillus falconensis]
MMDTPSAAARPLNCPTPWSTQASAPLHTYPANLIRCRIRVRARTASGWAPAARQIVVPSFVTQ